MPQLPRGTVTFLFTDIEGSTRLWDAFPSEMRAALEMHDGIVTGAVAEAGGRVVKKMGDGVFAAFASAVDASRAALSAQELLAEADWPAAVESLEVRMALHTATIEPQDGDYHGPDVNRVARIEATGHGGQILLSSTTRSLVDGRLDGVEFTDLGSHLLRGLSSPERVHQMTAPGRRSTFPPLRTASSIQTELPQFPTAFVGRQSETSELADRIDDPDCRLITLVGPGGIGKTRLAVAAAAEASGRSGTAARFLSLVGIPDASDVIKPLGDAVGFTFDIHISAQIPEKRQLFDRLRAQPLILVLDNMEHLEGAGELAAEMVAGIPTLTLVATSRANLDVAAEWRYEVGGIEQDAVALFVDRAERAGGTADGEADREAIEALCARLGGMPLAIEMAAAWSTMLGPAEIAAEIDKSTDLLTSTTSDVPERHRSIRAVFEQSWAMLPAEMRPVLARLSVFTAPFDRTMAADICGAGLTDLAQLAKRSLLSRHGIDEYSLHPLIREFAAEHAEAVEPALAERHARHFWKALIDRAPDLAGSSDQVAARDEVVAILAHIREASEYWVDHFSDAETSEAIQALNEFYFIHSWVDQTVHFRRLRRRFEARLGAAALEREAYLWTCVIEAFIETSFGTPDEIADMLAPIEQPCRRLGGTCLGYWLTAKGVEFCLRGDYQESLPFFVEALTEAGEGTPLLKGVVAAWQGWSHLQAGDLEQAAAIFDAGLAQTVADQHYLMQAFLLSKYGLAADAAGDHETAVRFHHEGREIFVKTGDVGGQGYTLSRLSWTHYLQGDFEAARRFALEGLAKFEEINHRWGISVSYGRLGLAEAALGNVPDALEAFLVCHTKAVEAGLVEQQHYAVTGIGIALAEAGEMEEAGRLLRFEATAEKNPYAEFAKKSLAKVPDGAQAAADDADLKFGEVVRLAEAAARRVITAHGAA